MVQLSHFMEFLEIFLMNLTAIRWISGTDFPGNA